MLKKFSLAAAVVLGLFSGFAWAAGEEVVGLWNVPDDAGTLEIKDDGTFNGTVTEDGSKFSGKWEIGPEGVLSLVRDDGKTATCKYTVADDKLTLVDCPIPGEYARAE